MKELVGLIPKTEALPNPFSPEMSGYGVFDGKKLHSIYPDSSPMYLFHQQAHGYFLGFVQGESFPCIAGKSVVRSGNYAFSAYEDITSPKVAEGVCHDLLKFRGEFADSFLESFMTAFKGPEVQDQLQGAELLYNLLHNMHEVDSKHGFPWADGYSSDTDSANFAFSTGAEPHFVSYFYPYASSETRKSEILMVLFNSHNMFQTMKQRGAFDKLKAIIRSNIPDLHPNLGDHGAINEFVQYALLDPDPVTQAKDKELQEKVFGTCPRHSTKL